MNHDDDGPEPTATLWVLVALCAAGAVVVALGLLGAW